MTTEIVKRATVQDLAERREKALDLYERGLALLKEAEVMHADAAPGQHVSGCPREMFVSHTNPAEFREKMRKSVDRDMWHSLMTSTQLWSVMDATARKQFEAELKSDPPPATVENILATLSKLVRESGDLFNRGLVKAFQELSRDYRSNDGFKIGKRVVMEFVYDSTFGTFYTRAENELRDVDRVMHVLDGKPAPDYQQGLCAAMREKFRQRPEVRRVCTEYWDVRWFKNGNAHLYPLREDLVDRANRIIAEHFGETLPDAHGKKENQRRAKPKQAHDFGFFPTPPAVVARMMAKAAPLGVGKVALEPSAGTGNIAKALAARCGVVDVVEIHTERAEALERSGLYRNVILGDFLSEDPEAWVEARGSLTGSYDVVAMNPPFANGADAEHVRHALGFLAAGGVLVAVMSAAFAYRQDGAYRSLRQLLERNDRRYDWTWSHLPEDSFKESGTNVRTGILRVYRRERRC